MCPAGGQHDGSGSFNYVLVFDSRPAGHVQDGWRSCPKCQGLHYAGFPDFKGVCPAGGQHDQAGSCAYVSMFDVPNQQGAQSEWSSCRNCQGMFYEPFKGTCPKGGPHDPAASFNYTHRFTADH